MSAFQIALNFSHLDTNKQENTHKSSNSTTKEVPVPKITLDKCFCFICPFTPLRPVLLFFRCVCFLDLGLFLGFGILLFPPLECMFNLDWFPAHDPRLPYM